jgi:hypothetical protein
MSKKPSNVMFWTTETEIAYLDKIGKDYPEVGRKKIEFLRGYIKSLDKRTTWNGVNRWEVKKHAEMLLQREIENEQSKQIKDSNESI